MATKKRKSSSAGVKSNGRLKKGYRYKKGGGVVKVKSKK